MATKSRTHQVYGFTLIELLVVVAIIALLISVLLPALAVARDQAKAAVCLTRLKNLGAAQQAYGTQYNGYIPGAPLTTGYPLVVPPGWWKTGMPVNPYDYSVPLFREMSMKLPAQMSTPPKPDPYFPITTTGPMQCPSNNQVAASYPVGNPNIPAVSYLTMSSMVRAGPSFYTRYSKPGALVSSLTPPYVAQSSAWEVVPPDQYFPRVEAVGRTSLKVFLADGLRYYDPSGQITYNTYINQNNTYGYQSAQPPCDKTGTGVPAREYNLARKFSYRHKGGNAIQAVMFDGHAEPLSSKVTVKDAQGCADQATGQAVHPKYYYPSNSLVKTKSNLLLWNDPAVKGWPANMPLP